MQNTQTKFQRERQTFDFRKVCLFSAHFWGHLHENWYFPYNRRRSPLFTTPPAPLSVKRQYLIELLLSGNRLARWKLHGLSIRSFRLCWLWAVFEHILQGARRQWIPSRSNHSRASKQNQRRWFFHTIGSAIFERHFHLWVFSSRVSFMLFDNFFGTSFWPTSQK